MNSSETARLPADSVNSPAPAIAVGVATPSRVAGLKAWGRLERWRFRLWLTGWFSVLGLSILPSHAATRSTASATSSPPPLIREFRGLWVASKGNIDWPSDPGLSVAQQQVEFRALLDAAVQTRMNAVVLQVRPQCDALYESTLEPWSEVLTGRQGLPPAPRWDPLAFAVREAHLRGLELHAWVNPFRARSDTSRSPLTRNHIINQHPEVTVRYGDQIWLDPGQPVAREHSLKVILDIVQRYDIDALHMDDYFYPYPIAKETFRDDISYERYRRSGGTLDRSAWRRSNVDGFVHQLGIGIHQRKPWVKFGISPFGIWRPGHPTGVRGLDAYEVLASDAVKWLQSGWVDYLAPQLYWPIDRREQSYAALLPWWAQQNSLGRHLWPGLDTTSIGKDRNAAEIEREILLARRQDRVGGVILYSANVLLANRQGLRTLLTKRVFTPAALVPASPWLTDRAPAAPALQGSTEAGGRRVSLKWVANDATLVRQFALQFRVGHQWFTEFYPGHVQSRTFNLQFRQALPDECVLTPIGRTGVAGTPARWRR